MYSLVIICDGWRGGGGGLDNIFAGFNLSLWSNTTHTHTHSQNSFEKALQQAQLCIINATFCIFCDFVSPPLHF